jgi:hypothetical protein
MVSGSDLLLHVAFYTRLARPVPWLSPHDSDFEASGDPAFDRLNCDQRPDKEHKAAPTKVSFCLIVASIALGRWATSDSSSDARWAPCARLSSFPT